MAEDFYKILGVPKTAGKDEIKKAYRKLARKWHPDINPGNADAEKKFKEISRAYDCLGSEEKRKLYDEFGEEGLQSGFDADKAREYRQWQSYNSHHERSSGQDFGKYQSYEDVFGDLFGSHHEQGGFGTSRAFNGRDIEHGINIDLVSALRGFQTELTMQKPKACSACEGTGMDSLAHVSTCPVCGGSGRVNVAEGPIQFTKQCPQCNGFGKSGKVCTMCHGSGQVIGQEHIKVTIPQGVKEGSKVRISGKGEPGMNGGKAGDLYLIVHLNKHPFLERIGDDLYMEVPVRVGEAMAGASITIPTIDGEVQVKIPPRSQSGRKLKLKGKGAIDPKTKKRGDLYITIIVKVPQTSDDNVLDAARRIDKSYDRDVRKDLRL